MAENTLPGGMIGAMPPLPNNSTTTPNNTSTSSNNYNRAPHGPWLAAPSTGAGSIAHDDDRSDAATIGTSIADWNEQEENTAPEEALVGYDAVKRWALRVNNSRGTTDPAAHADHLVDAELDELVLVAHSPMRIPHTIQPTQQPNSPAHQLRQNTNNSSSTNNSNNAAANADHFRRVSSKIDANILNEFLSTLDETDSEAVCNFIASYRGPDVITAMHVHLAKIQDLRASEQQNSAEMMPVEPPVDWESLPLNLHDTSAAIDDASRLTVGGGGATGGGYGSTENGLMSDVNEVWDQTEGGKSTESDWMLLDDISLKANTPPTLHHLPKRALTKILIYSQNPNLLKTSRRLSRVPLPTLGSDLAQVILALATRSPTSSMTHTTPSSTSSVTSTTSSVAQPPQLNINEILTRAARSPYANRSPLTFPCLAHLLGLTPSTHMTLETLTAVIDIASKERRWNSVRGALLLAKQWFDPLVSTVNVSVDDLVQQYMRRPFVVGGSVYTCLVANVVANHGKFLGVEFFGEVVESGGVRFGEDVIRYCSENYGVSTAVVEYLLERV
ncbi:hypothetical protein HDU98_005024 [Podochytrium sp. JEL0797]|nr:hypothetical protein HDU98_005024 [Podochytrium sp. JEL0797]